MSQTWLGNAAVDERNREETQRLADQARKAGDPDGAKRLQKIADSFAAHRDRTQREELRRQASRSAISRRPWRTP